MSAHQLHRMLRVTYRSAWFMAHRIRLAMARPPFSTKLRGMVEVDETYMGGKPENRHKSQRVRGKPKIPVVALVDRERGEVRVQAVANVTGANLRAVVRQHVEGGARLMTDGHMGYREVARYDYAHESVNHQRTSTFVEPRTRTPSKDSFRS